MLAKALAHYFESKLLLFDVTDFSASKPLAFSLTDTDTEQIRMHQEGTCTLLWTLRRHISGNDLTSRYIVFVISVLVFLAWLETLLCATSCSCVACIYLFVASSKRATNLCFDEKLFIQSLYKVLVSISETNPIIIYLRDVEKLLQSERLLEPEDDCQEVGQGISALFPYSIEIRPPEDASQLMSWKTRFEDDMKLIQFQDNKNHIAEVLAANDLECDDLGSICQADTMFLSSHIEEIVVSAISYHLMNNKEPEYKNGRLVISSISLSHGLSIFKEGSRSLEYSLKIDRNTDSKVFKDGLLKPCRGILLFGPPGTRKTMMAKAIANEAGASFINVSMSTITLKWFGEDEKNVRALFTLAAKVSPTIIFVDEVDSMLGQRTRVGEYEAMRKIKNEFMTHWDGLMSSSGDWILVLAATNRPFDLDEAMIRRFERRIMVGLPPVESREKILRTLLPKEKTENIVFHELAQMTDGYSGSDIKIFCTTAAYRPVRELIKHECLKDQRKQRRVVKRDQKQQKRAITLRALSMEDMRIAKSQVAASFAAERAGVNELKQ
ncbi:hypothetical protein N665_3632s0004 [Sinapis alba]|nr:hypothetical protein N665_3632s0004 [Sinapis alba]